MTGATVFPRLPDEAARQRLHEIRQEAQIGIAAVTRLASTAHPRAAAVATGGHQASADDLLRVRQAILAALDPWTSSGKVPRNKQPEFDAILGRTLHEQLRILPADAAHVGTWSFLTLVVLPDVAVTRFNDLADDRGMGTTRNVMRRAWHRWDILGDRLLLGSPLLGEDELVGLLERTAVARNRALVREMAGAVLKYDGTNARSEWARSLYKQVRRRTGPLMLDLLSSDELRTLVEDEVSALR